MNNKYSHKHLEEEVEKTLESYKNFKRFEGTPFLVTRIESKLDKNESYAGNRWSILLKPMAAFFLIAINIWVGIHAFELNNGSQAAVESEILTFADEYNLYASESDYLTNLNEQ